MVNRCPGCSARVDTADVACPACKTPLREVLRVVGISRTIAIALVLLVPVAFVVLGMALAMAWALWR